MKKMELIFVVSLIISVLFTFVTYDRVDCNEPAKTEKVKILKFGRIPFLDPRKMVKDHDSLMKYLKEKLDLDEARLVLAPNYEKLTEFLKEGKVDVAWHGTLAYPHAFEEKAGKAILRPKRYGSDSYRGIIITRVDSGINEIKDLKGKKFAFTDTSSASGYHYPRILMMKNGVNPDKDLFIFKNRKRQYLKKHDNILYAVLYKRFDAGAVYDDAREHLKSEEERNMLKIIARTPDIPNEPLMIRNGFSKEFEEKFIDAMMTADKKILQATGKVEGFVKVTDDDYKSLRDDIDIYNKHMNESKTEEIKIK